MNRVKDKIEKCKKCNKEDKELFYPKCTSKDGTTIWCVCTNCGQTSYIKEEVDINTNLNDEELYRR